MEPGTSRRPEHRFVIGFKAFFFSYSRAISGHIFIEENLACRLAGSQVICMIMIVICDAHDLPFKEKSFDAIICQAVLEHVADPYRCVEEMFRVLKPKKFIYVETPFMQQVHMAPYDFTRFTYLGHRRLFRRFKEIDSGIACGPGMS